MTKRPEPYLQIDQSLHINQQNVDKIIGELFSQIETAKESSLSKEFELSLIEINLKHLKLHFEKLSENLDRIVK